MIVVRAPLRISFVGGGTDLPDFYHKYPGRVLSTAIDKYVYVVLNRTPLIQKVSARYSVTETVSHPKELEHTRIKAALLDLGIEKGIEIASFASVPSRTGLGSSSSFSVALIRGLHAFSGNSLTKKEAAEAACRLEIDLVGEPIGKQDQYAAAFGGFNIFQFNPDDTVDVESILLDYKKRLALEDHVIVFFTGLTRDASSVLSKQRANIQKKFKVMQEMADSVEEFSYKLLKGDFKGMGQMLHEAWMKKKSLTTNISSNTIDALYEAGIQSGAWGGKVLGAGGGGCILFLSPINKKMQIRRKMQKQARKLGLNDFQEIPIKFVQSGVEVLFSADFA